MHLIYNLATFSWREYIK